MNLRISMIICLEKERKKDKAILQCYYMFHVRDTKTSTMFARGATVFFENGLFQA